MISMMNRRNIHGQDDIPQHPLERLAPMRKDKSLRQTTFEKWPKEEVISPEVLCDDGFYYMGIGDKVQCVYCGGVLSGWQNGDDVHREHARHFSRCPSLDDGVEDDIECDGEADVRDYASCRLDDANVADIGIHGYNFGHQNDRIEAVKPIQTTNKVYNTKYSLYSRRLESFKDWPEDHELKPEVLAEAGLYYKGL